MMRQILPDRERRHLLQFYLARSMGYRTRLGIAGGLIGAGLLFQLLWSTGDMVIVLTLTLTMMFVGTLFLLVKGFDVRPDETRGGDWEKTTEDRFLEVNRLERASKKWDENFADVTCVSGVLAMFGLAGLVGILSVLLLSSWDTQEWGVLFIADAAVLLFPHWVTGTRRWWRPVALREQLLALHHSLRLLQTFDEPPCQIQPMFQMAGEGDKRVPVAARVFVRFPEGPEDFLGLQFQVSLNNVQGTLYPYLYAVIIARETFGLHRDHYREIRDKLGDLNLTIESSSDDDVEVVVIRQFTTKQSGYHTKKKMIRTITASAWQSVWSMLEGVATP